MGGGRAGAIRFGSPRWEQPARSPARGGGCCELARMVAGAERARAVAACLPACLPTWVAVGIVGDEDGADRSEVVGEAYPELEENEAEWSSVCREAKMRTPTQQGTAQYSTLRYRRSTRQKISSDVKHVIDALPTSRHPAVHLPISHRHTCTTSPPPFTHCGLHRRACLPTTPPRRLTTVVLAMMSFPPFLLRSRRLPYQCTVLVSLSSLPSLPHSSSPGLQALRGSISSCMTLDLPFRLVLRLEPVLPRTVPARWRRCSPSPSTTSPPKTASRYARACARSKDY